MPCLTLWIALNIEWIHLVFVENPQLPSVRHSQVIVHSILAKAREMLQSKGVLFQTCQGLYSNSLTLLGTTQYCKNHDVCVRFRDFEAVGLQQYLDEVVHHKSPSNPNKPSIDSK